MEILALVFASMSWGADIRFGPAVRVSTPTAVTGQVGILGSVTVTPGTGTVNVACTSGCSGSAGGIGSNFITSGTIAVNNLTSSQTVSNTPGTVLSVAATGQVLVSPLGGVGLPVYSSATIATAHSTSDTVNLGGIVGSNTLPFQSTATFIAKASNASIQTGDGVATYVLTDTSGSVRTTLMPNAATGYYFVCSSSAYTGTTQGSIVFSFRWGNASNLAIIDSIRVEVVATATTTAGLVTRNLWIARSFTASDTGGTSLTPSKKRSSMPASLVTDVRSGVILSAGTRTLDSAPAASIAGWMAAPSTVIPQTEMLDTTRGGRTYPLVLAQNEGFEIQFGGAAETASTRQTFTCVDWHEVSAY